MKQTCWAKINSFPPIVCRLLARTRRPSGGVRPLTTAEIAKASGMSVCDVISFSWKSSWEGVPFEKIRPFMEACGVFVSSRENYRMHATYIHRTPAFKYLKRSPDWLSFYLPLIAAYVSSKS